MLLRFEQVPVIGSSVLLRYSVKAQLARRSVCWLCLVRVQISIVLTASGLSPYPY